MKRKAHPKRRKVVNAFQSDKLFHTLHQHGSTFKKAPKRTPITKRPGKGTGPTLPHEPSNKPDKKPSGVIPGNPTKVGGYNPGDYTPTKPGKPSGVIKGPPSKVGGYKPGDYTPTKPGKPSKVGGYNPGDYTPKPVYGSADPNKPPHKPVFGSARPVYRSVTQRPYRVSQAGEPTGVLRNPSRVNAGFTPNWNILPSKKILAAASGGTLGFITNNVPGAIAGGNAAYALAPEGSFFDGL